MVAVVCLGEALIDRLGPPGGDPQGDPTACDDRMGGAPANVASALARLGSTPAFVGRLGQDAIGVALARFLAEQGVDTSALQWDATRPSRIVLVRRDLNGERQFGGFAGDLGAGFADQALAAADVSVALDPLLEQALWLLLGTIPLASPAAAEAAWLAIRKASAAGVALAVDVNWRPTFWDPSADPAAGPTDAQRQRILPLLQQAQLLKCAAEEAEWLFGYTDPQCISAALPRSPLVVVSAGGAPLRWGRASAKGRPGLAGSLQPFQVDVVDTTGAGDALTAGLLHGLCTTSATAGSQEPMPPLTPTALTELMLQASACAALVCQGMGAIDPQPTASELAAFLRTAA